MAGGGKSSHVTVMSIVAGVCLSFNGVSSEGGLGQRCTNILLDFVGFVGDHSDESDHTSKDHSPG